MRPARTSRCDFHSADKLWGRGAVSGPEKPDCRAEPSRKAAVARLFGNISLSLIRACRARPVQWRVDRFERAAAHLPNHAHQLKPSHKTPAGPGRTVGCARIPCGRSISVSSPGAKWPLLPS